MMTIFLNQHQITLQFLPVRGKIMPFQIRTIPTSTLLFFLLFLIAGTSLGRNLPDGPSLPYQSEGSVPSQIENAIESIRQAWAPDRRVAVFDISWEYQRNRVLLKGEVDNPITKERIIDAILQAGYSDIDDQILVLPHPDLGENIYGMVRVSVGNMRFEPRYTSELVTQVLMGMPIRILKRRNSWFYVQSPDNYLGWMSAGTFERMDQKRLDQWNAAKKIIVTGYHGMVYEEPDIQSLPVSDVITGNRIKVTGMQDDWFAVALPDGRNGFLKMDKATTYENWTGTRNLTPENIAATSKLFIGVPYLWGGTSAKGFDCSGFTKKVFWLNGMDLSRDASQQIQMGEHVDPGAHFKNLKTGDLLFFGQAESDTNPERIVHVGIYLGNREFIHSSYLVRINSLDPNASNFDRYEYNRFVRARRLIH